MGNFFEQAPARDTFQKRFWETVGKGQNVMASFPLSEAAVSLYAFAAMLGEGMVVVLAPNTRQIQRNLSYFKAAGFRFPDVAYLDGTQMPHEERAIYQEINRNKVRLLYTTPQRFTSLTFLDVMVHATIPFLVIEEADRFLPITPGHTTYRLLLENGLGQLRQLPPLVLLMPPLAANRHRELAEILQLKEYQLLKQPPAIEGVQLQVRRMVSEQNKFNALTHLLLGRPTARQAGRLDQPGGVLIQAAYPAQAEKLGASLRDYGFESVWISHVKKSAQEQAHLLEIANSRLNAVIVNAGSDFRYWSPPQGTNPQLIFWTPPASLDDLLMQAFRQSMSAVGGDAGQLVKSTVFYTKEDYQAAIKRLLHNAYLDESEIRVKSSMLRHYRNWVLSEDCRVQSLAAYYQTGTMADFPPCGQCDRCLNGAKGFSGVRRTLVNWAQRWLY